MDYICCSLLGYVFGCFNPAYLVAKMYGYGDIREEGSGNAGASNAGLLMGRHVGIAVALMDIFKAVISMSLASAIFPHFTRGEILAGSFTVLGHMFPINMRFRGGKGLAAFAGVVLMTDARLFCAMCLMFAMIILITDYLVYGVVTAIAVFPVVLAATQNLFSGLIVMSVSIMMLLKHRINFRRIGMGLEYKISYIWDKEAREEFKKNYEKYCIDSSEASEKLVK